MDIKPCRRSFAFSLRTLMILIAAFAVWLGWQLKIVRDRRAMVISIELNNQGWCLLGLDGKLPLTRRLLGDQCVVAIQLASDYVEHDLNEVQARFPEASVWRNPCGPP